MIARVVHACIATAALTVAGLAGPVADQPALAAFSGTASGPAAGVGQSIPQAAQPTATVARRDVTVSWPPTTLTGGTPATSYSVRRRDADGVVVTALTSCGSGGATSCVDSNVPTGDYRYTVQAMVNRWQGAEGAGLGVQSTAVNFSYRAASSLTDVAGNSSTRTLPAKLRLC